MVSILLLKSKKERKDESLHPSWAYTMQFGERPEAAAAFAAMLWILQGPGQEVLDEVETVWRPPFLGNA
jgi:hypothetical protein